MAKTKQIPILVLVFTIFDGLILISKSFMIDLSLSKQIEPYNFCSGMCFLFTQQFEITKNV